MHKNNEIGWDIVPTIKQLSGLPVFAKGVMCKEDARLAIENGIDGIICYKFIPGWYYTLDFIKVVSDQVKSTNKGSYCYSNDGINCYSDYGPSCDPLTGYMCSTTDGINPYLVNYCVTVDNVNCR